MKKIFYILASAIVALGAVACQNEVDENINPNDTKEITFNVSFDESTRIAGTVEGKTAKFEFEGDETLYVGSAKLTNSTDAKTTFVADAENRDILNGLVDQTVTATVNDEDKGLKFANEEITLIAGENVVELSLACPALYFTVPADATATLSVNGVEGDYTEGSYFVGIDGTEAAIAYSINGLLVKEKDLTNLTNKVYNLGTLDTDMTVANVAALIEKAEAGSTITLPAGATITGSEILTIDKNITIDGNGATFTSTAERAINVSGKDVEATIENLTVVCSGERGVNVIQNAKSVTLNEVNITAANYAVNVAKSAPDAQIAITNSTLHGLCTVNVASLGADVTLDNCTVYCDDDNTAAGEGYAALSLGKESEGGSIIATNTEIYVAEDSDSFKGRNSAKNGTVTINGSDDDVYVVVAVITYEGPYYHSVDSVDAAIEFNAEQGNVGSIALIRDAEISTVGTFKIDLNGCTLTAAEGYNLTIDEENNTVTVWIPVATVGGVEYKDLASAVAAAADGGTVTLVSDVAIENLVQVNGDVTIEGNATISNDEGDVFKVLNGGSLTIGAGVTIESTTDCGIFTSAGANDVNVVINGTVRSSASNYAAVQFNGGTTDVTLTVNGTIESENEAALYLPANGEYTIANGAKITGKSAIVHKGGKLTIEEGATLIATGDKVDFDADKVSGANCTGDALVVIAAEGYSTAEATINGGSFTSTNGAAVGLYAQEGVTPATVSIKGGTFNTDPSAFVAEGYKAFENEGVWTVNKLEKSEWELSDSTPFYLTQTDDLFVAYNVKLSANNFCLHKVGDTAWGAGAKYGLVTAGTKNENTAIGLYSANWAGDITINNASTTAHDIYFDKANSRLYVLTVGKTPAEITAPTNATSYNIAGTMNDWGGNIEGYKFTYAGDNVWHIVVEFAQGAEFKVQTNNDWNQSNYGIGGIQDGVGKSLFEGSDNAKVKTAGTYEIWVVPAHGSTPLYIIKK